MYKYQLLQIYAKLMSVMEILQRNLKISSTFTFKILCLFVFWPCCTARGISVSQSGIEPMPHAVEAQNLNHWTAREVPYTFLKKENCDPNSRRDWPSL